MEYPFIHKGCVCGTLTVTQSGLFTVFELICRYTTEILRVKIYGEGEPFYLGIPQPRGKGLYLCRKLTKREMTGMPTVIKYASAAEEKTADVQKDASAEAVLWQRHSDGTLTCRNKIAIPASLRASVNGAVIKNIEGRTYMLFYY